MTGRVVRLGLTPLKGARHTPLDAVDVDEHGPVGDRVFCLVDASRRRVLKTVQHPSMPGVLARWDGTVLEVTLPSGSRAVGAPTPTGESLACDYWGRGVALELQDGPHAALLSDHLGRPVRLAAAPRGGVVYGGSVSVVTTASVRALAGAAGQPDGGLDPARLRATVVVDAGDTPFVEDGWVGRELRLGAARVRVAASIPRCAVLDLDPETGGRNLGVLAALGDLRPAGTPTALRFGVHADVTLPGRVSLGDAVHLVDDPR